MVIAAAAAFLVLLLAVSTAAADPGPPSSPMLRAFEGAVRVAGHVTQPVVIFRHTTDGFPCSRIPAALAVPGSDIVLAFAENRR